MDTKEVTGAQLASLLSEVEGFDQYLQLMTRQMGSLLGADDAHTDLAPFIRRVFSPQDITKMNAQRTIRLEKIERLNEEIRDVSVKRNAKWAEFLQLLAKT